MKFVHQSCAWLPLLVLFASLSGCKEKPLFERLDSSETGIEFANTITDSDSLNILNYQYIYNGGGVGVGDFNGDDKPDLFFAGNQVANKLYLNEGDLKFRDVTGTAGVGGQGRWCSGVSVVDVNADGKMDVYVSTTLHKQAARRANLLYVNQGNDADGNPRFRDMAAQYGIADTTYTTHSAFFDYDNDGDLDLYVLVDQIFDEKTTANLREQKSDGTSPNVDRLYRNMTMERRSKGQGPQPSMPLFVDVSREAGILFEGFGLGMNICDINRDGWKDIYVTNDFASNDLLYINNRNGTFTNRARQAFKHTSYSAMGNDVADINHDGLADIVAMDMLPEDNLRKKSLMGGSNYFVYQEWDRLGYEHQYARNTLQLNRGVPPGNADTSGVKLPAFSEIAMLAGVAETEWSWAPLLADFDHDGHRDLLVTNGFPRDVTDRDFTNYYSGVNNLLTDAMRVELIAKMPTVKVSNYGFRGRGDGTFENLTDRWGLNEPSFSNGAAYADLDDDGDLDYVINNINDEAFVYRNTLTEKNPDKAHFLRVRFVGADANPGGLGAMLDYELPNGNKEVYEHTPYRGFLSSVEPVAHLGLGEATTVKNLKVTWPDGRVQVLPSVNADQTIMVKIADAQPATSSAITPTQPVTLLRDITDSLGLAYRHEEADFIDFNQQKTLLHKFSEYGPALAVGDVNGDGTQDMIVGGSTDRTAGLLLQQTDGRFTVKTLPAKLAEDAGLLLFDADADGDLDLYAVSGGVEYRPDQMTDALQHRLYVNDGRGTFTLAPNALPKTGVSGSCVKAADYDGDGDLDLFVGGRVEPNKYPAPVRSFILRNDVKRAEARTAETSTTNASGRDSPRFTDVTTQVAPTLVKGGLTCDALWTDVDNDRQIDLLIVGEWEAPTVLRNNKGRFDPLKASGLESKTGFWNSLTAGDFDNDGDTDYLAGNLGQNTLLRASDERPVRMYAGDFDNNGFYDAFTTVYFKNAKGQYEEYPYFGWDDMVRQMIGIKKRYIQYAAFGQATINDILTEDERSQALKLTVNCTQTSYIENLGNGTFNVRPLPLPAQTAPVFGMLAQDIDGDGNLDAVLVGNDSGSDLVAGRMDAFDGLVLRGDGKGGFTALTPQQSGFYVPGYAKAVVSWPDAAGRCRLAVSQNRGAVRIMAFQQAQTFAPVDAKTWAVDVRLKNGRIRRQEIPYGSSFYSQSARGVWLQPGESVGKKYSF
ncbi:VCBS repeat-containing protein [Spirosoma montaniterrae]|uniref:RNA-binding protein n=1 Tax=Spirosoma montaniterrae TaxID=1178516 RepID=A0A1P9X297_9BACT|nr:VCBS repeat-containing protein [Spirosoma montaniterrae]AQG81741.1 RNA-binding protein [Spirosoma montaniterrae]